MSRPARPLLALAALLLVAGAAAYAAFVLHVLDRGDRVVHEAWRSSSARTPLLLAAAGITACAAAGAVGRAALRGSRWRPVGAMGIPAAIAGALGLLAFAAGPGAFAAALSVLACFAAAALGAALLGGPGPLWRAALRN
ncbi:MAG TPA: hypothetical protein VHI93_08410, partial [Candidatus Thermoplasmatota archaeon]|nr:hypothetical protein [Candidatus Thermoplasmatota archaeon]